MPLSKSKCWYSNNCLHFLKRAVPLFNFPAMFYYKYYLFDFLTDLILSHLFLLLAHFFAIFATFFRDVEIYALDHYIKTYGFL